ncbi:MAG TPA: caspase family protein, partial [Bacteroidia bacterium]|nr:caspase family protein [Bacteroidia bacterium]
MKTASPTSFSAILNRCLLGFILLATGLALPARTEAQDQRRIALVVGNDDYQHASKLSNAVNDSRSVAKALRHVGFDVIHVENASIDQFDEALSKFMANGRKADVGLFYFAGHGIEFDEQNFLLPVDASPENHAQLKRQAMSLEDVLEGLKNVNLSAKMAVLDCCRDH